MRITALKVSLLSCALLFISAGQAQAITMNNLALTEKPFDFKSEATEKAEEKKEEKHVEKNEQKSEEKPVEAPAKKPATKHTVTEGETLTSIAELYQTTWNRLYAKNIQIVQPDVIAVTDILDIPEADEIIAERAAPVVEPVAQPIPAATNYRSTGTVNRATTPVTRGSSAGNTYAAGYCTWYAKSRRPDLPNRLGNASAWVGGASAQGFATGRAPQVGAIGQQGNHVVYVESVNGDGTVTVSEMNYKGLFITSSRTTSAGSFTYIY